MKAVLIKAWINQKCQNCNAREKEFVWVKPDNVEAKFRLCMKCFKKYFKDIDLHA